MGESNNTSDESGLNVEEEHQLRIAKARYDAQIAQNEAENYKRKLDLEQQKTWLTFGTIIITVIGLILTFFSQRSQISILQTQRTDDSYTKKVELLTTANNENSKLAAITGLFDYIKDETDVAFKLRTIGLLCIQAESDTSLNIKTFIRDELVRNAPLNTIEFLASQNRDILKDLESNHIIIFDVDHVNAKESLRFQQLLWNINTINRCLKKINKVENIDLSNVALNHIIFKYDEAKKDSIIGGRVTQIIEEISTTNFDPELEISDITFKNVNFSGSELNGQFFKNVSFDNCKFDNANMISTHFENCKFLNNCSFNKIKWMPTNSFRGRELESHHPIWENCDIQGVQFIPFDTISSAVKITDAKMFLKSNWQFDSKLQNTKFSIAQNGRTY